MDDLLDYVNLHRLPLRSIVACGVRSAMRAQPYADGKSGTKEEMDFERINVIGIQLVQTFCREGLNRGSRLSAMAEDDRWSDHDHSQARHSPAIEAGERIFEAAMQAAFGDTVFDGVATGSMASAVVENTTLAIAVAMQVGDKNRVREAMATAIKHDYEKLLRLNLGVFPEIGVLIDPGETGPLGPLWPDGPPQESVGGTSISDTQESFPQDSVRPGRRPGYLYKYVTGDALLQVLRSRKVRCTPPISFNDPFDCQIPTMYRFGRKQFLSALKAEIARIISTGHPVENGLSLRENRQKIANLLKRSKSSIALAGTKLSGQFSGAEILSPLVVLASHGAVSEQTINGLIDMLSETEFSINDYEVERRVLHKLASLLRVFCLSSVHDNLLMWAHYANDHRGAVIEFQYVPLCAIFSRVNPVRYSEIIPETMDTREFVRHYLGLDTPSGKKSADRLLLTKGLSWSYEKEWRGLIDRTRLDDNDLISIGTDSISAVYLGCRFPEQDLGAVISEVEMAWPHTKIYMAYKDPYRFGVNFVPIRSAINWNETKVERIARLKRLYNDCSAIYLEMLNGALVLGNGDIVIPDSVLYQARRLRCSLGESATPDIRDAFIRVIELAEELIYSKTPELDASKIDDLEQRRVLLHRRLKPSAIAHGEFERLTKEHISCLGLLEI